MSLGGSRGGAAPWGASHPGSEQSACPKGLHAAGGHGLASVPGGWGSCPPNSQPFSVSPPPSSKLQRRLEKVTDESQERMDDQAATIAKLNKVLQGKIQVSPRQNWASSHPGAEPNWDGAGIWDTQNLGDRHRAAPRALRARITSNVSNPVPRGGGQRRA